MNLRAYVPLLILLVIACSKPTSISPPKRPATPEKTPVEPAKTDLNKVPSWLRALRSDDKANVQALKEKFGPQTELRWMDTSVTVTGSDALIASLKGWSSKVEIQQLKGQSFGTHVGLELTAVSREKPAVYWHLGVWATEDSGIFTQIRVYGRPSPLAGTPEIDKAAALSWTHASPAPALEKKIRSYWNTPTMTEKMAPNMHFQDRAHGLDRFGPDAYRALQATYRKRFPSGKCQLNQITANQEGDVWLRSTCGGVYLGDIGKKGHRIEVKVLDVVRVDEDEIETLRSYSNPEYVAEKLQLKGPKQAGGIVP